MAKKTGGKKKEEKKVYLKDNFNVFRFDLNIVKLHHPTPVKAASEPVKLAACGG